MFSDVLVGIRGFVMMYSVLGLLCFNLLVAAYDLCGF